MRAIPTTVGFSAGNTFYADRVGGAGDGVASAITSSRHTVNAMLLDLSKTGGTSGQGAAIVQDGTDAAYIEVSAEL
jgi:hypothetical protein